MNINVSATVNDLLSKYADSANNVPTDEDALINEINDMQKQKLQLAEEISLKSAQLVHLQDQRKIDEKKHNEDQRLLIKSIIESRAHVVD
jgi:hypothetical protein